MNIKIVVSLVSLIAIALIGCGIVDEEEAQAALDIKKQILEIQTTELDPLMDQIALLQESIEPLEQLILLLG